MIPVHLVLMLTTITTLSVGTLGFANTLTVQSVNPIGASYEDITTLSGSAKVVNASWTETVNATTSREIDIGGALVTVMNSDSVSHSYQVCAIVSDDSAKYTDLQCGLILDLAGSNTNGTATLTFTSPIDVTDGTKVDISVEETK